MAGGSSTHLKVGKFVASSIGFPLFLPLLFVLSIDVFLGALKSYLMVAILPRQVLFEVGSHLINIDFHAEHFGLFDLEDFVQFGKSRIGRQSLRLDFILVGLLVKGETVTCDRRIHSRPKVGILLNNVPFGALHVYHLPGFVHLAQHLDSLPMNLLQRLFLVILLLHANVFRPFSMLLLLLFFTFGQGRSQKVQALVLEHFDFIFALIPIVMFLILHQQASESKAGLVGGWRQSV